MTPNRLRDFSPLTLTDADDTPADTATHRTMSAIARRTRRVLFLMLALCAASFATSAVLVVYQFTVLRNRREVSREIQLELLSGVRQLLQRSP